MHSSRNPGPKRATFKSSWMYRDPSLVHRYTLFSVFRMTSRVSVVPNTTLVFNSEKARALQMEEDSS